MKAKFVILGGGLAGLCAAIRLAELGTEPLLIEAGNYPSHKVCGEFLSPICLEVLQRLSIVPIPIYQAHLRTSRQSFTFNFPIPAGSLSHLQLDPALAQHAQKQGARLLTATKVEAVTPSLQAQGSHVLKLVTGETIDASRLLIATGRFPHPTFRAPSMDYIGLKAHFRGLPLQNTLEMFSFPGAYLGLSPIEDNKFNVACLARINCVQRAGSAPAFLDGLCQLHPLLKTYLSQGENLFTEWMQAPIPVFGIKSTPYWPQTYWLGDAAGTIPPACGNGLSMAITSGYLAAEHAFKGDDHGFRRAWQSRYASSIRMGKLLHQLMLHPAYGNFFLRLSTLFPSLAQAFFTLTR